MTSTTLEQTQTKSITQLAGAGAIAGLGGGLLFGMMMAMMGMLPMVGMLVRQENSLVGFIVHMAISAILGVIYGVIATRLPSGWAPAVAAGVIYGIVWWILGALLMMPLMLGMNDMIFVIEQAQLMSLMGHVVFGVVTALLFIPLNKRI
jgi:uncharacterized membrane protein YagU involved in acid resistance